MLVAVSFLDQIGSGTGPDTCVNCGILRLILWYFQVRDGQTVYAYEVDGLGNQLVDFDDPNIPSLMSIPLLGYGRYDEKIYRATRARLFRHNPYYVRCVCSLCIGVLQFSDLGSLIFLPSEKCSTGVQCSWCRGSKFQGWASPHTPSGQVWHLGWITQGLTSQDPKERVDMLRNLLAAQCGNGLMHETVNVNMVCGGLPGRHEIDGSYGLLPLEFTDVPNALL